MKITNKVVKAHLPHPLVQNAIFEACRFSENITDEAENIKVVFTKTNTAGDVMKISSPRKLKAIPDMGVFLAGIALAQNNISDVGKRDLESGALKINTNFPIKDFYDLISPKESRGWISKNRAVFDESLKTLADTSISVAYAPGTRKKHGDKLSYIMKSSLWDYEFVPVKGRNGGIIRLAILRDFFPRNYYIWADAALCNRLELTVSRQIFWQLLGREHFKAGISDLASLCGFPAEGRLDMWLKRNLSPSIEELNSAGYRIKREGKGLSADYVFYRKKSLR